MGLLAMPDFFLSLGKIRLDDVICLDFTDTLGVELPKRLFLPYLLREVLVLTKILGLLKTPGRTGVSGSLIGA